VEIIVIADIYRERERGIVVH